MKMIKSLYTLSNGEGIIHISKDKTYELKDDGKSNFIIDNTGKKMIINSQILKERFE